MNPKQPNELLGFSQYPPNSLQPLKNQLFPTSFDLLYEVVYEEMEGESEEKENKCKSRIKKYFTPPSKKIDIRSDYLCEPIESTNLYDSRTLNAIMVYGIDFLGKKQLSQMFKVGKVNQIDGSSVEVIFSDTDQGLGLIKQLMVDPSIFQIKIEEDEAEFPPRGWYEMKPYYMRGIERKIHFRFMSESELKIDAKILKMNQTFQESKKIFNKNFKSINSALTGRWQTWENLEENFSTKNKDIGSEGYKKFNYREYIERQDQIEKEQKDYGIEVIELD